MRSMRPDPAIRVRRLRIPTAQGSIPALGLSPKAAPENAPGILWLHGGGYVAGMKEMVHMSRAVELVKRFGAVVLSPGYRLALQAPYPAAMDDCYAALLYLRSHAAALGVRSDQLMVGGESAGGGLCAAVCIRARDEGTVNVAFQMPLYPMLDDRTVACDDELDGLAHVWFAENNKMAWEAVLGERRGTDEVLPCEAPARNESFEGLAPAFLEVGELDLFRDETIEYAKRLMAAHVPAELHVLTGLTHTFDTFPLPIADKAFEYRSYVISQL